MTLRDWASGIIRAAIVSFTETRSPRWIMRAIMSASSGVIAACGIFGTLSL